MIENDSMIITGNSLIQVFDRLEVAEFSARALLDALVLGVFNPINDDRVEELKIAFDLK